jgi:predicted dehydrogenase
MPEKVNLAIIGCGGMARAHTRAYRTIVEKGVDTFTLTAMCDPVRERAESFADEVEKFQKGRPRIYTTVAEMLTHEKDLRAVDICTSHGYHHASAISCLESGVDVMIEKPIGITVKATRKILETAEKHGRIVATAENIRRHLGQRTIKWVLDREEWIGKPLMFFAQHAGWHPFQLEGSEPMQWRVQRLIGGGGMVMDSGAHYMDSLRYFFGDVEKVYAEIRTLGEETFTDGTGVTVKADVEDTWVATFTFKSGLIGVWSWSRALPGTDFTRVIYYGTEGSIEDRGDVFHGFMGDAEIKKKDGTTISLKDLSVKFLLSLPPEEKERLFPYGMTDGVALECYDFIEAVRLRRRPDVDGWDGLKAKSMSEAIFESSWCGQAVRVDDVIEGKIEGYQKAINEKWGL